MILFLFFVDCHSIRCALLERCYFPTSLFFLKKKKKGTGNTIFALLAAIFVLRAVNHEKFGKIGKQSEAKGGNQFQKDGGHWLAEVVAHCLAQVRRKQRRMHPYRS